jgi:hypothetical protein
MHPRLRRNWLVPLIIVTIGGLLIDRASIVVACVLFHRSKPTARWFVRQHGERESLYLRTIYMGFERVQHVWVDPPFDEFNPDRGRQPGWRQRPVVSGSQSVRLTDAAGWPTRSAYCEWLSSPHSDTYAVRGGILWKAAPRRTQVSAQNWGVVPLLPVWHGIAVNVVFWGGVLLLPYVILMWHRQRRAAVRSRRGLCPRCAYDWSSVHGPCCPECGLLRAQLS